MNNPRCERCGAPTLLDERRCPDCIARARYRWPRSINGLTVTQWVKGA